MVKADDNVKYEGDEEAEKYTYFELLQKTVEQLKDNLDEISGILIENNIYRKKKIQAPYFNEDKLYNELEEK